MSLAEPGGPAWVGRMKMGEDAEARLQDVALRKRLLADGKRLHLRLEALDKVLIERSRNLLDESRAVLKTRE